MTGNTERIILSKLENLEDIVNSMRDHGCSKARMHDMAMVKQEKMAEKLRLVELAQAEGKGKFAVCMIVLGIVITLLTTWWTKKQG